MDGNEYQRQADSTAVYSQKGTQTLYAVNYAVLGMLGEAGELANKLKKVHRGDYDLLSIRETLIDELGDVLWYVSACGSELGISLNELMELNIRKLSARRERGTLKGTGDTR